MEKNIFETEIDKIVADMGHGLVTVKFHLHDGNTFVVAKILEKQEGTILVEIYGMGPSSKDELEQYAKDDSGGFIFDRIILPYQAISYISFTTREPNKRSKIGFS